MLNRLTVVFGLLLYASHALSAQTTSNAETAAGTSVLDGFGMESVKLNDGKVYYGLIQRETNSEVEFLEIVRSPGKPMFALLRPLQRDEIGQLYHLRNEEHEKLAQRLNDFRNRVRIETSRLESINLQEVEENGFLLLEHQDPFFTLRSTTTVEMTRRTIARVQQIVRACTQLLPPRTRGRAITILLFGDTDQYHHFLQKRGIDVRNPAVFFPHERLIVAGSALDKFSARLAISRKQNADVLAQHASLDNQKRAWLDERRSDLSNRRLTQQEIESQLSLQLSQWQKQYEDLQRRIRQTNRRNSGKFDVVMRNTLRRIYHELSHAYLRSYVFPSQDFEIPAWLDEGLAQILEYAEIDVDTLRIDSVPRDRLEALQTDLLANQSLDLVRLLQADTNAFLASEETEFRESTTYYNYAWGITYHLFFRRNALAYGSLDKLTGSPDSGSRREKFEQSVNTSLAVYASQWRADMLELTPTD